MMEMETYKGSATPFAQTYFHGTKADLKVGDYIETGYNSNYGVRKNAKYIFLSATLDAAIWGAELAFGEDRERIYLVEPTGEIEDDPDLTDKKFAGNPTKSYRSEAPFLVVGEVANWQGHATAQVKAMKDALAKLREQGIHSINDDWKNIFILKRKWVFARLVFFNEKYQIPSELKFLSE